MRATTLWAGRGLSARCQVDEAFTASAATITPHGVTLFWDQVDPAKVQPAHSVFVVPIAPMALTPISRSLRSTSTVSGGSLQTALPSYWGPVKFRGGICSLKLTPAATWTQVTVTKLTFNVQTQSVRVSINGHAPVIFALVNEMGMTEHPFMSGGRTYVRIEGASLSYALKAAAAFKVAFGWLHGAGRAHAVCLPCRGDPAELAGPSFPAAYARRDSQDQRSHRITASG